MAQPSASHKPQYWTILHKTTTFLFFNIYIYIYGQLILAYIWDDCAFIIKAINFPDGIQNKLYLIKPQMRLYTMCN